MCNFSFIEKDFNLRKNHAALFVGVIDGANYLLDINDEWAFKPKGKHYIIMCTEEMIQVCVIVIDTLAHHQL